MLRLFTASATASATPGPLAPSLIEHGRGPGTGGLVVLSFLDSNAYTGWANEREESKTEKERITPGSVVDGVWGLHNLQVQRVHRCFGSRICILGQDWLFLHQRWHLHFL